MYFLEATTSRYWLRLGCILLWSHIAVNPYISNNLALRTYIATFFLWQVRKSLVYCEKPMVRAAGVQQQLQQFQSLVRKRGICFFNTKNNRTFSCPLPKARIGQGQSTSMNFQGKTLNCGVLQQLSETPRFRREKRYLNAALMTRTHWGELFLEQYQRWCSVCTWTDKKNK